VTRVRVAASLLAALPLAEAGAGFAAAAEGAAPACLARAQVVPPEGFPGQQLVWRLEILRRADTTGVEWAEPPSFPGFRAEWLPGQPELGGVLRDGVEFIARVEERALFPERSGELVIPEVRLRCAVRLGSPREASAASTRVRVLPFPEEGRPPGFGGLVGAPALEIAAKPNPLALGGSTRVEVTLRGNTNLWDARDPLTDAPGLQGLEIFPARPRLELEPGVQLSARRRFAYDVVPEREGRIEIPELRVPYFDPEQRHYGVATSPALVLEVGPRAPVRGARPSAQPPAPEPNPRALPGALGGWMLVALGTAAAFAWSWRRRARGSRSAAILAELGPSGDADEAARLARALRRALEPHLAGARTASVEEMQAVSGAGPVLARALALLAQVERSRFDPDAPPARRADAVDVIRTLDARPRRRRR
jgi:hypothetical protein